MKFASDEFESLWAEAVTQGLLLMQKHNGFPGHLSEVLAVVPPALKEGWQKIFEQFELKYAKIVTNDSSMPPMPC